MPRSTQNPYKERRINWVHYSTVMFLVVSMTVLFVSSGRRQQQQQQEPPTSGGGGQRSSSLGSDMDSTASFQRMKDLHRNSDSNTHRSQNLLPNQQKVGQEGEQEEEVRTKNDHRSNENDDGQSGDDNNKNDDGQSGDDNNKNDDGGGAAMSNERKTAEDNVVSNDYGAPQTDDDGTNNNDDEPQQQQKEQQEGESEDNEELDSGGKPQFDEDFPTIDESQFNDWIHFYHDKIEWDQHPEQEEPDQMRRKKQRLNSTVLNESLRLGCDNLVANQKEEGNFNYQYDFVEHMMDTDDNQVRQAGALWGVALCFQSQPTNKAYQKATEKGIRYFTSRTIDGPTSGSMIVQYDTTNDESDTGTNALFGLSMIEYLKTLHDNENTLIVLDDKELVTELETKYLVGVIQFLKYMQDETTKHFSLGYSISKQTKSSRSSSYFDGEAMLCLIKAARYMDGYNILIPRIVETVPILCKAYTVDEWKEMYDSDLTKGFYQWSSMFMTEYYNARWKKYTYAGDYVITMAHWVIHTHKILERNHNTGYAYEGMISAYAVAKNRFEESDGEDTRAQDALNDLRWTIDQGLYSLTQWQVGSPLANENKFLVEHPTTESIAVGGVMNSRNFAPLRIDTTQHQMHSVMLALEHVYNFDGEGGGAAAQA